MLKRFNQRLSCRSRMIFLGLRGLDAIHLSRPALRIMSTQLPRIAARIKRHSFKGYVPTEQDIFVAAYPKSGNSWLMQIAAQIVFRGYGEYRHIHDIVAWPNSPLPELVIPLTEPMHERTPTKLRIIKSQLTIPATPYNDRGRYLIVLRDPKDALVSLFHFGNSLLGNIVNVQFPLDGLVNWVLEDRWPFCWAEHASSWWALREQNNVFVVTFSEMKQDLAGVVGRIANILDVTLSPDELNRVVYHSTFSYMKENESVFSPPWPNYRGEPAKMLNTGRVGENRELLSNEQRKVLDEHFQRKLDSFGSELPYEEMFIEE